MFVEKFYNGLYSIKRQISDYSLDLFSRLFIRVYLLILILINASLWIISYYINSNLNSEEIALHYNVDFGINLIGRPAEVYIIPVISLIFLLLNLSILLGLKKSKERIFAAHVLLSGALASSLILLVAIATVYLINFR